MMTTDELALDPFSPVFPGQDDSRRTSLPFHPSNPAASSNFAKRERNDNSTTVKDKVSFHQSVDGGDEENVEPNADLSKGHDKLSPEHRGDSSRPVGYRMGSNPRVPGTVPKGVLGANGSNVRARRASLAQTSSPNILRKGRSELMVARPSRSANNSQSRLERSKGTRSKLSAKVLVVGNAKSGKSSMIQRLVHDTFDEAYRTTVGADYARKEMTLDGSLVRLQLWDIAGQDRFAKLTRAYFSNAKGAIVVCDVSRDGTVKSVGDWKAAIDEACGDEEDGSSIPVVLVANKVDLLESAQDSFFLGVELQKLCTEAGFCSFFISSAKSGFNVAPAMEALAAEMLKRQQGGGRRTRGRRESCPGLVVAPSSSPAGAEERVPIDSGIKRRRRILAEDDDDSDKAQHEGAFKLTGENFPSSTQETPPVAGSCCG